MGQGTVLNHILKGVVRSQCVCESGLFAVYPPHKTDRYLSMTTNLTLKLTYMLK